MGIKQKEENTNGGLHNTLAAGTTVKGDIVTETDFRLDGKIEGDVSCSGKIVIGPKGNVTGNIVSTNAEILGEVEGSIHVWRSNRTPASTGFARCQGKNNDKILFHNKVTEPEERFLLQFCDFLFYI